MKNCSIFFVAVECLFLVFGCWSCGERFGILINSEVFVYAYFGLNGAVSANDVECIVVLLSFVFERPFVSDRCLSVCPVCNVGVCGQTVGWIKMKLGIEV